MPTELPEQKNQRFLHETPYEVLVEQSLVGIYLIQGGVLKYCNSAFAAITGHKPEQIIDQPISSVVAPQCLQNVLNNISTRISNGVGSSTRYFTQARHIDGHLVDLEVHGRTTEYYDAPAIAGVAVNMTQQLSYERELQDSHKQLRLMSQYANNLREHRRQKMAGDIHDVLGGLLTSIKLSANRLINKSNNTEMVEIAEEIMCLAQESIDFARSKSEQLYPATLNYLGLIPTVENLLKQQQRIGDLSFSLVVNRAPPELSSEVSLVIYRTIQEAITNVQRHAQASQVLVHITTNEHGLIIQIDDDGVGILDKNRSEGSIGLLFMKERAAEYQGEISTSSGSLGGTRIQLALPMAALLSGGNHD